MKILASKDNIYKVALTGKFDTNTEDLKDYLNLIVKVQSKLKQIDSYCKTYKVPVIVYASEEIPHVFYSFLFNQGFVVRPIVSGEKEIYDSNTIETQDINKFIEDNCNYVMIICDKEYVDDFDFEIPNKFIYITKENKKEKRITPDPALTLREAHQTVKQKSDPYSAFYHELLYEIKPFNYYDEIMQTMPDNNALTNREYANVKNKKS